MIWDIVTNVILTAEAEKLWRATYEKATPEVKALMLAERERERERAIARQREETEERRHREMCDAIRASGRWF